MLNGNLTLDSARYNTNAPFTYDSGTSVNGITIPPGLFLSIKVSCRDGVSVPVRLGRFSASDDVEDVCKVSLIDAEGNAVGVFYVPASCGDDTVGTLIFGKDNVLIGNVVYNKELSGLLWTAVRTSPNMSVEPPRKSFVLLPQCHSAYLAGHMRALDINGTVTCADTRVLPGVLLHTSVTSSGGSSSYSIGVIGPYERPVTVNGLKWLRIYSPAYINGVRKTYSAANNVWIGGEHIVIRHATASNIRVTAGQTGIELRSVLDG